MTTAQELEVQAGLQWMPQQLEAMTAIAEQAAPQRLCLYFRTGGGKTYTALACVAVAGWREALVVAPPITHTAWHEAAARLGMAVETVSHAKFRMPDFKVSRSMPLIADEFHLFGGHAGKGWKKLDRAAKGLQAPVILASATPNYNDAERVYCIQHILDPIGTRGGYLQFLYENCTTEENQFGSTPIVTGFRSHTDAADYLSSLPKVVYLPDELEYKIQDIPVADDLTIWNRKYNWFPYMDRIAASLMELRHMKRKQNLLTSDLTRLKAGVFRQLKDILKQFPAEDKVLIFCNTATVARATQQTLLDAGRYPIYMDGSMTPKFKQQWLNKFIKHESYKFLIGTATLATGTDGIDKVCDHLIILDDTDDAALRRQVIGRIMPRGEDSDASHKTVHRFVLPD